MKEFPDIEWVDEPPPTQRGNDRLYQWFAKQLREHPGQWGKLPNSLNKAGYGGNIASGKIKAFSPAGHYEAVVRRDLDGEDKWTYVRYIGPVDESPEQTERTVEISKAHSADLQRERNPDRAARIDQMMGGRKNA